MGGWPFERLIWQRRSLPDNLIIPIKEFSPQGLEVTEDVMGSPQAKAMMKAYMGGGATPKKAAEYTAKQLGTGENLPAMIKADPDTYLIKLVPRNAQGSDKISEYSSYFVTPEEYGKFSGMTSGEIAGHLGLPAEQGIRSSQLGFDAKVMVPKSGETPFIFKSKVAPIKQGEYSANGGAEQIIVPDRTKWTDPNRLKIRKLKNGH